MKEGVKLILFALFWVAWGAILTGLLLKCGRDREVIDKDEGNIQRDTVVLVDTIVKVEPVEVRIVSKEIAKRRLPLAIHDTIYKYLPRDSIDVEIPITQIEYRDSNYQAWVSGFEPRLDSLKIFKQTDIITVEKVIKGKRKKWHVGPTIGYGYTPQGFQPYIGLSLTYSLIEL